MEQEELISKKELLLLTGISYGQLYRWKRQHLIPDAWFMKQSSYTGQETYFPKEKVLERIEMILKMKDTRSLDDLARFFSPEQEDRTYPLLDAMELLGIPTADAELILRTWEKHQLSFMELLFIALLNEMDHDLRLTPDDRVNWLETARRWVVQSKTELKVVVFRKGNELGYLLIDESAFYEWDAGSEQIAVYDLSERTQQLQLKLHSIREG